MSSTVRPRREERRTDHKKRYVKGLLDHCLARNQLSKGRVEILKEFRAALDAGLEGDGADPRGA